MSARILSGAEIAKQIRAELKEEIAALKLEHGVVPGLATVLVGDSPASVSYVTSKNKTSKDLGMHSVQINEPEDVSEAELLRLIDKLNRDPRIDGILIQLPLPRHISEEKVLVAVDPGKDVDAFHPVNVGKMVLGNAGFLPCTPAGIQQILVRSGVETSGAEVVVVGRSNIVGKPIANILVQKAEGANATVTLVHTKTRSVEEHCRRADILIVAAGVPRYVKGSWIKPGAVVIDVGVNRIGTSESGKARLAGDVDFAEAVEVASAITPVPGGVGPMTITMLMVNTVKAARMHHGLL
ncbi:MAG: tetrahydrofolate dehydrogenase/cyclohydrolase catalytic domain-containing protein [Polyangia bacterium]|jgi:methylenetetrahydrofolate dehydrogenase (NADP+)/methenyltetrahydrofolate cyclohydrolase|nr:tetrahydrofolate dehydrogenase/cyclohydrolase catalytic domain-containing protein [Polyangia bacterium]